MHKTVTFVIRLKGNCDPRRKRTARFRPRKKGLISTLKTLNEFKISYEISDQFIHLSADFIQKFRVFVLFSHETLLSPS